MPHDMPEPLVLAFYEATLQALDTRSIYGANRLVEHGRCAVPHTLFVACHSGKLPTSAALLG